MKKLLMVICWVSPVITLAQSGIQFSRELSWTAVLRQAKEQHKYIFVDCYATWCGPCKAMDREVFSQRDVGDFVNEHFVSVKVQSDTTKGDSYEIKNWYEDAKTIFEKYHVKLFPTYLFFSPDGIPVHRVTGSMPKDEFISIVCDALDPNKQYFNLLKRFNEGETDSAFLRMFANLAYLNDQPIGISAGNKLINQLSDPWSKDAVDLMLKYTRARNDRGFIQMLTDTGRFNAVTAPHTAQRYLSHIIYTEEIAPFISPVSDPDWKKWEREMVRKYPQVGKEAVYKGMYYYYGRVGNWNKYAAAYDRYLDCYGGKDNSMMMNNLAWEFFRKAPASSKQALKIALKWSEDLLITNNATYIDTYANLLFKLGRREEAIKWEQKAVTLAGDSAMEFKRTLEKMVCGVPTW